MAGSGMVTPRVRAATGSSRFRREGPERVALPRLGRCSPHPQPHHPNAATPAARTPGCTRTHRAEGGARGAERALRTRRERSSKRAAMAGQRAEDWSRALQRRGRRQDSRAAGRRGDGAGLGASQLRPQGGAASSGGVCDVPVPPRD